MRIAPMCSYSQSALFLAVIFATTNEVTAFTFTQSHRSSALKRCNTPFIQSSSSSSCLWSTVSKPSTDASTDTATPGFIETELRGAAMKLHTRSQAPKEGEAKEVTKAEPYVPTLDDYLKFLVDSKHVYEALEDAVNNYADAHPELTAFQNTGLERTLALEADIQYLVQTYDLTRPSVGSMGSEYVKEIRQMINDDGENDVPGFICHYYNFYFAHTAGGRMIGKKMSALLLNKHGLEFYKWDGNLNKIKDAVKESIESLAAVWNPEEKAQCVAATAGAFRGGGGLNAYLFGGKSGH